MMHSRVWLSGALALLVGATVSWAGRGDADASFERTVPAKGLEAVAVEVVFQDVTVTVEDRDDVAVTVELEARGPAATAREHLSWYEPRFEVDDGVFTVRSVRKRGTGGRSVRMKGRVRIHMPSGPDLRVETSSGDCTVTGDLGEGRVEMDTSSGDLILTGGAREIVTDSSSGDVRLVLARPARMVSTDSSSGDLVLDGGCGLLKADTSSGDVTASGLTGDAEVDTSSGDVSLRWASVEGKAEVEVDTSSGDVELVFPEGTVLAGEVSTSSGSIRSEAGGTARLRGRQLELPGGKDAVELEVETASGDVKLLLAH